jgi:phosphatidylglycerophosphate synthase
VQLHAARRITGWQTVSKVQYHSRLAYQFTDSSVARPALTRLWFARLFPLLPQWLPANLVSLLSCGSLLSVLALSLAPHHGGDTALALVSFAALQVYVIGDHLDGMQAVASSTASPLGDFIDHYCDLWAGCILLFGFWSLLGTASAAVLYSMTALLIFAFAVTYTERATEQRLHFTRWGTLEIILLLSIVFASWAIPSARDWWRSRSPVGLPWYFIPVAIAVATAAGAVIVIVRRMRQLPRPLVAQAITLIALVALVVHHTELPPVAGWLLIAAYGGQHVAEVMHAYLEPRRRSWSDPIASAVIVALAIADVTGISPSTFMPAAAILGVYLGAKLLVTLARILGSLRRYWVWVNRPIASELIVE